MSASSSENARSRTLAKPVFTFSEKCSSKVNSLPSCSDGIPEKLAVSGSTRRFLIVPVAEDALVLAVVLNVDRDRLAGRPGAECQRAARRGVVVPGLGGAVRRRVVDGDGAAGGLVERDRERRVVSLLAAAACDAHRRGGWTATARFVIVPVAVLVPRSEAPAALESVTVNVSSLSSVSSSAIDTAIVLMVVPASKVSSAGRCGVVASGRRGPVRGGVVDGDGLRRRLVERDSEGDRALGAFGAAPACDADARRRLDDLRRRPLDYDPVRLGRLPVGRGDRDRGGRVAHGDVDLVPVGRRIGVGRRLLAKRSGAAQLAERQRR